jgi:hypothetical protein
MTATRLAAGLRSTIQGHTMRLDRLASAAIVMLFVLPVLAQEWTEFTSRVDRFTVNLPGEPKVQEITWPSEYGAMFPGRVYAYAQGPNRYSVTVIDYTDAERIHAERPNKNDAETQGQYWQVDV